MQLDYKILARLLFSRETLNPPDDPPVAIVSWDSLQYTAMHPTSRCTGEPEICAHCLALWSIHYAQWICDNYYTATYGLFKDAGVFEIPLDYRRLAELILSYECDEPHIGEDASPYYPQVGWTEIESRLEEEHCGDCNKQPQPCLRCWSEYYIAKAKWLAERYNGLYKSTF